MILNNMKWGQAQTGQAAKKMYEGNLKVSKTKIKMM